MISTKFKIPVRLRALDSRVTPTVVKALRELNSVDTIESCFVSTGLYFHISYYSSKILVWIWAFFKKLGICKQIYNFLGPILDGKRMVKPDVHIKFLCMLLYLSF